MRWQKAVQQQMMLLRMAKQNEMLDQAAAESPTVDETTASNRLSGLWDPLLEVPPVAWDEARLRNCMLRGGARESGPGVAGAYLAV